MPRRRTAASSATASGADWQNSPIRPGAGGGCASDALSCRPPVARRDDPVRARARPPACPAPCAARSSARCRSRPSGPSSANPPVSRTIAVHARARAQSRDHVGRLVGGHGDDGELDGSGHVGEPCVHRDRRVARDADRVHDHRRVPDQELGQHPRRQPARERPARVRPGPDHDDRARVQHAAHRAAPRPGARGPPSRPATGPWGRCRSRPRRCRPRSAAGPRTRPRGRRRSSGRSAAGPRRRTAARPAPGRPRRGAPAGPTPGRGPGGRPRC